MGFDFRYPNITGTTEREQLSQLKSFLHQHIDQLQWALNNAVVSNNNAVVTPNPKSLKATYDVAAIQETESPEVTFASIKPLIIKSAEIIEAYYEEINKKLVGEYVAQSDFGVFEEQTSQDVFENSTNINRSFSSIQEIKSGVDSSLEAISDEIGDVDSKVKEVEKNISTEVQGLKNALDTLNFSLVEVTANLKSGLLYYDANGVPVYGLEIGQKNLVDGVEVFNKFARFTAGRLSFYDHNGVEVAYISDYRLYIFNVEITGIYKIGGLVDTVLASGDVVEKWVGRG